MLSAPTQRLARRAALAAPPFLLALAILLGSSYRAATREEAASLLSTGKTVLGQTISYPAGKPAKVTAAIITILAVFMGADGVPNTVMLKGDTSVPVQPPLQ
jgi:hypothetical protein